VIAVSKGKILIGAAVTLVLALVTLTGAGLALAQNPTPTPQGQQPAWVGIRIANLNEKLASNLGLSQTSGVVILEVVADSPADSAGLKRLDIITKVDGKAVANAGEVVSAVRQHKPGDQITFEIQRGGQTQSITVTAGEVPKGLPGWWPGVGPFKGWKGFGMPHWGVLPQLKDIPLAERFGHLLGSQFRFLDKDNKPVTVETIYGTVVSASKESITIKPNDPGLGEKTFAITSDTKVRLAGKASVESLQPGDPVVVTTTDGKTALTIQGGKMPGQEQLQQFKERLQQRWRFPGKWFRTGPGA